MDITKIKVIIFDLGGTLKVSGIKEILPDSEKVLRTLSKKYRLALGANQPLYGRQFLNDNNIEKYFDKIYLSVEIGYKKPDLRFFQYILDDLNLDPKYVVMVGDNHENDIAPARKLGIKTIWINALEEEGKADFVVGELIEILTIL